MSKELATKQRTTASLLAMDLDAMTQMAEVIFKSKMIPTAWLTRSDKTLLSQEEAVAKIAIALLYGREAGFAGMSEVFKWTYVVNGMPAVYGQGHNILIDRHRSFVGFVSDEISGEGPARKCTVVLKKKAGGGVNDIVEVKTEYTMQQAITAGIASSDTWRKYPDDMLRRKAWARMYSYHFSSGMPSYDLSEEADQGQEPSTQMAYEEVQTVPLHGLTQEQMIEVAINKPHMAAAVEAAIQESVAVDAPSPEEATTIPISLADAMRMIDAATAGLTPGGRPIGAWATESEIDAANTAVYESDDEACKSFVAACNARLGEIKTLMSLGAETAKAFVTKNGHLIKEWHTGQEVRLYSLLQ